MIFTLLVFACCFRGKTEARQAMRVGQKRPRIRDKYTWDEQQHVIGEGTYGIVYRATPKNAPNRSVAIKKFKNTKEGEGISLTACREITVLETSTLICLLFISFFANCNTRTSSVWKIFFLALQINLCSWCLNMLNMTCLYVSSSANNKQTNSRNRKS